jgi:hypothetical protein
MEPSPTRSSNNLNAAKINLNQSLVGNESKLDLTTVQDKEGKMNDSLEKKLNKLERNLISGADFTKKLKQMKNQSAKNLGLSQNLNASVLAGGGDRSMNVSNLNMTGVHDKSILGKNNLEKEGVNQIITECPQINQTNIINTVSSSSLAEIKKILTNDNLFLVTIESKKICDFFSVENRYINNPRLILFDIQIDNIKDLNNSKLENQITNPDEEQPIPKTSPSFMKVFIESYEYMLKLPITDEYLKGEQSLWYKSLYYLNYEYDLNDLTNITFQAHNIINLIFYWTTVKIIFHDDYSYFNVRSILLTYVKSRNFEKIQLSHVQ